MAMAMDTDMMVAAADDDNTDGNAVVRACIKQVRRS